MKSIFAGALASTLVALIAHSGSLDGPLRRIAVDLANRELVAKEAAKAASSMTPDSLVNESLAFLFASTDSATEAAAVRFLLALETFPFDEMHSRFKMSTTSTERAYTLHLLNLGARDQTDSEIVRKLAESVLYDKGSGLRRYGEARACSSEGKRVCDVAYNILVSKMGLGTAYPLLDVDNNVTIQRDQMIEKLGIELNLPKPLSWDSPTQSSSGPVRSDFVPPKSLTPRKVTKVEPPMTDDESQSSTPRTVVFLFIVAAIGLLWLVIRKRN